MCRIKIAHVTTADMSLRYLLLNQLTFLQQMGYGVVGISAPGNNILVIEAAGVRHISIPMSRKTISPVTDLLTIWRLYRVFRRESFTIVHTHFHKSGIYGRWAAKLAQVPIIVHTNHGLIFQDDSPIVWRRLFITLEKFAAKCSDLIFSVNEEDIRTLIGERICSSNKVQSIGQGGIGIDLALFDPARFSSKDISLKKREIGIPSHVEVVGFVGRLVREKGILELFEAAQIVRQRVRDVCFLIVGPIDSEKNDAVTPDVAADYGVSDICICTGIRQDMPELYALMNLLVLPSYREGFPRSPMEASAMGVPCIVTDIRGCREVVEHGRNGVLAPLGNVQALADAIVDLLTDKEKAQRMGGEGRKIAIERFDERQVFKKVESEYARLLREKGFPVPSESQDD